jgi:hypothetical protein
MPRMSTTQRIPEPTALTGGELLKGILKIHLILRTPMVCLEQQDARWIQKRQAVLCSPDHVRVRPPNSAVAPEDPFIRRSRLQHDIQLPSARFWIKAPYLMDKFWRISTWRQVLNLTAACAEELHSVERVPENVEIASQYGNFDIFMAACLESMPQIKRPSTCDMPWGFHRTQKTENFIRTPRLPRLKVGRVNRQDHSDPLRWILSLPPSIFGTKLHRARNSS